MCYLCIPLISDQTPWTDVKNHGGSVFKVDDIHGYAKTIEEIAKYDQAEFNEAVLGVQQFAMSILTKNEKEIEGMFDVV